jgi:2-dehydropantoate 2-reductase
MRVAVFGAGAIGAYLGALLKQAGVDVTLIARGEHLAAMQRNGVTVRSGDTQINQRPFCTDDTVAAGIQDYVLVTLKAQSGPGAVDQIQPLLGDSTAIVTAMNGVPWWYFYRHGGALEGTVLNSVDPGGRQWQGLGPQRAIGCVVYPACEVSAPGVIEHLHGDRLALGEPGGEKTDRVLVMANLFRQAGLKAPVRDIRQEIWLKLWGNVAFNPISALTGETLDVLATTPDTRQLVRAIMLEAQTICARLGVQLPVDVDRRIDGTARVGAHRTSMLQDLERGRPLEIDAVVGAVQELGSLLDVPTPTLDLVLTLVKHRAQASGCY